MAVSLEKRVAKLEKEMKEIKGVKPIITFKKQFRVGDTFELLDMEWIILDITEKGYVVRTVDMWKSNIQFDEDTNDWKKSSLRKTLNNDFYKELADVIGEENIIPFERDLTTLDGDTDYGVCEDKISLLNLDEYRKYKKLLKEPGDYSFLITADSTKNTYVLVVSPRGDFSINNCGNDLGVRPFCIFSSSIFESEE